MEHNREDIAIIGMGFVGVTLGTVLANAGYRVVGYDLRTDVSDMLNRGETPFHEQGLSEAIAAAVNQSLLRCTSDPANCAARNYVICVGTPVDGANLPLLQPLEQACEHVSNLVQPGDLVILRSTVPPGVTRSVALRILESGSSLRGGVDFDLAFAPERTAEGKALRELRELPQVVGGLTGRASRRAAEVFSRVTDKIIEVGSLETAELVKTIDNTYRDCRFAYANEIAAICEACGVDALEAISAANLDYARNNVPMPSPGVGGPCLTKDPYLLASAALAAGYAPQLVQTSRRVNAGVPLRIAHRLHGHLSALGKEPTESCVFVMGFAFKGVPETSDTRGSCAVALVRELVKLGYRVRGHDPVAPSADITAAGADPHELPQGFAGADAAAIMNNHPSYSRLPLGSLLSTMRTPAIFFDGWRAYDRRKVRMPDNVFYLGTGYDCVVRTPELAIAQSEVTLA